ncbi:hypothetical protein B296_00011023 [Ensete ventricosum]|uniref:Uncharacterized protein n=1 Tax=Ensete ventricosum TaxID=4639 RepID=A0A426ZMP3_ENSVE|nr:hypothetical protein B296_00011023 [Ensete ventricosum]
MQWDLVRSSLGDSPKEAGSSLGMRREIVGKKTRGLTVRLPEYMGNLSDSQLLTVGKPPRSASKPLVLIFFGYRFDLHPKKIGSECRCASRRRTRK